MYFFRSIKMERDIIIKLFGPGINYEDFFLI